MSLEQALIVIQLMINRPHNVIQNSQKNTSNFRSVFYLPLPTRTRKTLAIVRDLIYYAYEKGKTTVKWRRKAKGSL